ncbi:MAG TPA: 16S rRNA (cytosine(1402)-N(4))-methyltransferase RsmH [Thermomicrobiales bacterium]|nr:16S rRNA (cytosine(1402)-N(4))-methyltransferase RsmH [Thermomicrobiales bacterium]
MLDSPTPTEDAPSSLRFGTVATGHVTVLLAEAVDALSLTSGKTYVDATFGGGGHSRRILEHQPPIGHLIAFDADLAAVDRAGDLQSNVADGHRLELVHANFRDLGAVHTRTGAAPVAGVLFDLGVSSYQFDEGERGFSFRYDAPLDMRFDQSAVLTAGDIVNGWDQADIASVLWTLGEERKSRPIAAAIVRRRSQSPIETTGDLATIIERAVGGRRGNALHPATRSFQALRIVVNGELNALEEALAATPHVLAPGGRLVVISFHSLEDRIVKRFIEQQSLTCVCPPEQPVCTCTTIPTLRRVGKPIRPQPAETDTNPRSRSAIMRVAERLDPSGKSVTLQGHSA